ncbi:Bifunctional NAD(P)H-hydrate repair enzyme Nnr (Includes: ADP-dependent (S)-NAD(P)H-hydrate dehydratase; NAD(P)H-hydrate epimerase) [Syntrophobacter sp. SbD1]|nr:Bifunctional NAD(P)H-hydrate repair enzyme Nnr (Includes: ADP-dependent (S)-NAD(P)H-hydrate dehydratase; NAD(P)H-hydrate epimerase) [Syntrophobacter sp. SbD1]
MLVLSAGEMAALDEKTIREIGIPGIVLMENAARGAADFFLRLFPDLLYRRITVIAGSGNNAGDGFALARIFHSKGAQVSVVCLRSPQKLSGDALTNFRVIEKIGVPTTVWNESGDFDTQWEPIRKSGAIIDAILGTGIKSEVKGLYRDVIERLNGLDVPLLAVDVPSGLDATTGLALGAAVKASATATFGFYKIGHLIEPGTELVGQIEVIDIGIPPGLVQSAGIQRYWLTEELVSSWIEPRHPAIHKGRAGHVCVLSGSLGKTGAAALVCQGAGRAGAGLVTLFIPESLNSILEVKLTETMTLPIAETSGQTPSSCALHQILDFLKGKQALAIGPGISTNEDTANLVRQLLPNLPCPTVLDADAITAISESPEILRKAGVPLVLTPHPGEMARLCHCSVSDVQRNRLESASKFSRDYGVVLVLKGHRTIIAAPDGRLAINSTGNPAMAGGGTGDTLTGIIAGLLAQGFDAFQGACLGVYVHGAACDRIFDGFSTRGLLATDMLDEIPAVLGQLEGGEPPQP